MFLEEQSKAEWLSLLKSSIKEYTLQEGLCLPPFVNKEIVGGEISIPDKDFIFPTPWLILCNAQDEGLLTAALHNGVTGVICPKGTNLPTLDTQILPLYFTVEDRFSLDYKDDIFGTTDLYKRVIDLNNYKNEGVNIVHELAIALKQLYDISQVANQKDIYIIYTTRIGGSFLEEIAKLRSMRYLAKSLGKILDKNIKIQIFVSNAVTNKTKDEPVNNIIRTTIETMAAVLGSADGIYMDTYGHYDKEISQNLAQNIQHLLVHESEYGKYSNMIEGAYAIEYLSRQAIDIAWRYFIEIRDKSPLEAEAVFIYWCEEDALHTTQQYDSLEKILVGVNKFKAPTA